MMDQNNNSKYSPIQKDTSTPPDHTTVVPANKRLPPLERGHYTKIGGTGTLKHEISSPKFYELLIRKEPKGDTVLYLNNFYKNIKKCLNVVNRIREDLRPAYQSIKIHTQFEELFIPDRDHPSYFLECPDIYLPYIITLSGNN